MSKAPGIELHIDEARPRAAARWLALGGIAGPVLFNLAWLLLGMLRPPTKTDWGVVGGLTGMITQPISGLGVGPEGLPMNAAFVVSGLFLLAGVLGVFGTVETSGRPALRGAAVVLLALSALGMVVDGVFTLQSAIFVHLAGFLLACGTPIVSFVVAGVFLRAIPRWRRFGSWLLLGSPLTLVLLVLYFVTFDIPTVQAGQGVAGLTERLLTVEVLAWFVAMSWLAFRRKIEVDARTQGSLPDRS